MCTRVAFLAVASAVASATVSAIDEYEYEYEYIPNLDPIHTARVLGARNATEARKLGGVYGLCAMDVQIPNTGVLVCDPPDKLPQICTFVCHTGYYSSGQHRDIACADAMCEGQCKMEPYECKGAGIKFATRPCEYMRYTPCEETQSGLCIETVSEMCAYSFYEEISRPCCNITQINPPEDCWTSGCTGSCESAGVFHYYSTGCGDVCPPWRDPETPNFGCSPCKQPTEYAPNSAVVFTDAKEGTPPSQIRVECEPGYWGASVQSYCISTDGTFYPAVSDIQCFVCTSLPELEGERFERQTYAGTVEFHCLPGYVGDFTASSCNKETGLWSPVYPPYCEVAPTPSNSLAPMIDALIEEFGLEEPSATPISSSVVTSTVTVTVTVTPTASASKSPRPPKVKGSRAPTQPPKLRTKA